MNLLFFSSSRFLRSNSTVLGRCSTRTFTVFPPPIIPGTKLTGYEQSVGNTRLLRLKCASEATGCDIYGKCEWENPGGSVKDRAALWMIKDAEKRGKLQAGKRGIIVEGTAGNTGIGLALAGISRGYDVVICLANTQSQEKKNALEQAGAVLVEVPAVPYKNPNNYVHVAERMASEILASGEYGSNVFYANQWDNLSNRQSHIDGTGPEIWEQLGGNIDAFSCATGTGGTLTGVGEYLRSQSPEVKVVLTDPEGGAIVRYFTEGKLRAVGSSISQGIGQGRITGNMRAGNFRPDMCFEVSDMEMLPVLQLLQQEEGICVGGSAGINVAGAIKVAEYLGPGHTIVTVLCDKSERYASQLYNARFLNSVGLPAPTWIVENERKQKRFQKICEESLENVNEPT